MKKRIVFCSNKDENIYALRETWDDVNSILKKGFAHNLLAILCESCYCLITRKECAVFCVQIIPRILNQEEKT